MKQFRKFIIELLMGLAFPSGLRAMHPQFSNRYIVIASLTERERKASLDLFIDQAKTAWESIRNGSMSVPTCVMTHFYPVMECLPLTNYESKIAFLKDHDPLPQRGIDPKSLLTAEEFILGISNEVTRTRMVDALFDYLYDVCERYEYYCKTPNDLLSQMAWDIVDNTFKEPYFSIYNEITTHLPGILARAVQPAAVIPLNAARDYAERMFTKGSEEKYYYSKETPSFFTGIPVQNPKMAYVFTLILYVLLPYIFEDR